LILVSTLLILFYIGCRILIFIIIRIWGGISLFIEKVLFLILNDDIASRIERRLGASCEVIIHQIVLTKV